MFEVQSDCQRQFQAAVSVIQALPKNGSYRPSHEKMLKFYSYYKQATVGSCSISRPGFWDPVGRIKWDAWKALGNLSKKDAMMTYVEEIKQTAQEVIDTMSGTGSAEQQFHLFEPLYEVVKDMPRPPGFSLKKVSGENVEAPLMSTPGIMRNGMLKNHNSSTASEEQSDEEQVVVTNRKTVRFHENEVSQDGDANNETIQTNGFCPQDGDLDPELGISQNDTIVEIVRKRQLQEHPSLLHDVTDSSKSYTVEVADQNHFTSDSESEVFCDSVEELDHEKISAVQSSRSVVECSQDPFGLQDTESATLPCSVDVSTCRPNAYRSACDDLPQNQVTQARAANGGRGNALDGGSCEKRETTFTGPRSESEWLTEGKGVQLIQGGSSQRNRPRSNTEASERRGHQEKSVINLNDKIARVLHHLQEDMQFLSQRLSRLEDLTTSQVQTAGLQPPYLKTPGHKRTSRWVFGPSGRTMLFLVVWPFVAQWIVHVFLRRRRS
ncbi:acyl-CoA-binding domain-containing protein 5-like isoform X1 [Carcharodon carcharias]|uniref:acyl-CoA-binding domain-containing protein 5-like isoform X1 n=1 Tax=Carcharodon carcharias TaxID=13397 RepID=UPI001B7EFECD|nr:acyl-CoA-binding domain-containing protein 5-like isoform X1 [Carcharodon carcharias]XP_041029371.1 acyl-CoA-binding domain-containing protein 5-like isoform X1 [Carcharodon carcharias]XP_041029372.1 acyl-CoA-binding domain-containing protein 5-like isoform X1 [Carcharodon carcharias]XP_041029373.1 acyl-CoA-binding domain-containing protein 5-like isoform X1 [Carcharodon carcharias]XP_041029374.1 acyl-CoA-binding domain-containing protein 5-like isoform X1 [Carcharodon carcharias]